MPFFGTAVSSITNTASLPPTSFRGLTLSIAVRGLQAPGKEAEKEKWPYLINNGRTNIVWQNAYLDQENEFVMEANSELIARFREISVIFQSNHDHGTLTQCDPFGIPSTSHWMGAAIIVR